MHGISKKCFPNLKLLHIEKDFLKTPTWFARIFNTFFINRDWLSKTFLIRCHVT